MNSMHYILRDGKIEPAGLMEWAAWFEHPERRMIDRTKVCGYDVSTIFLGLDHSFGRGVEPILFETMVFGDGERENWMWRYATLGEAKRGHYAVVEALRTGVAASDLDLP